MILECIKQLIAIHSTPSTEGSKLEREEPAWHECNGDVKVTSLKGLISRIMRSEEVPGTAHGAKTESAQHYQRLHIEVITREG